MSSTPKLELPKKFSVEPIAIVGIGAIMPNANSVDEFWQNILTGKDSIREIPHDRWDPELYYDKDRSAPDKTYSKIGAFIENFVLNSIEFRIPPTVLTQIDMVQQWALVSAKEALEDANYKNGKFPNEKCAVIIGNSLGGEKSYEVSQRVYFPSLVKSLKETDNFSKLNAKDQNDLISQLETNYKATIPIINEDSMPGELANIIAGRIAAVFNLRGKNMTSDAACASSLAALDVAYKGLQAKEFDAVIVGGSDRSMDPPTYVKFAKIGALSPDGSRPFDKGANGFVMGEGSGMMILKRLSDARDAGDKIYALIIGIGSSSDGKGKGITAPNPIGQELAIRRALESAQLTPKDIQLVECHGTSTSVGDLVELETLEKVYKEAGVPPKSVKIGSIKSQIGHLKSAAGAAGLLKAILAIHNKVFPPSINFNTPNPKIDWENSPLIVNTHPQEWTTNGSPRRVAVSSFGFGGTNFNVIIEEYDPSRDYIKGTDIFGTVEISKEKSLNWQEYIVRNRNIIPEPIFLSSSRKNQLVKLVEELQNLIPEETLLENEFSKTFLDISRELSFNPKEKNRVGFVYDKINDLTKTTKLIKEALRDKDKRSFARAQGIYVSNGLPTGKLAFIFPGQGSQYADMIVDLAKKYKIVEETFSEADDILKDILDKPLTSYVKINGKNRKQIDDLLRQTQITQPAMLTVDIALFRLFEKFGLQPDMVAGHSLGEYAALVASGVLSFKDALMAVAIRGKAMSEVDVEDKGTMASISGKLKEIESILKKVNGYVIAANKNSPSSTVISGSTQGVEKAIKMFEKKNMNSIKLSVSAAFHTKIVEPAAEPLSKFLDQIKFNPPSIPITSNVTGEFFPNDPEKIRELIKQQVGAAVEWNKQVLTMFNSGATIFFEIGPKRALSTFVGQILEQENILSVACNHPKKGGVRTFNEAISALFALGYDVKHLKSDSSILHPEFRWPQYPLVQVEENLRDASTTSDNSIMTSSKINEGAFQTFMDQTLEYMQSDIGKVRKFGLNLDKIVITGVGVGLPGKHKEVFAEDNIDRLLRGENLIDSLSSGLLDSQLNKKIHRLIKKSSGEAEFYIPKTYDDIIRLAGQQGKFDLIKEFHIDKSIASTFDISTQLAVAAGLEALKDAGIPLIREYRKTTTGGFLPGGWVLPLELQDSTGVIFASAFPGLDSFAKEITNYHENKSKEETRKILTELYGEISRRVTGIGKDILLTKLEKELSGIDKAIEDYSFDRKLLLHVLSMGHSQFAQLIKARGPNTQVNAACASTTQAIGIANDWIRNGRCSRVVIISGDNVTTDTLFEWLGSGFLASGAASIKDKVEEAALPFDRRREGMVIGMGAAGFMVETESGAAQRGVTPIVEIMGTHSANSAYHGTRLDERHVSSELQKFMNRIQSSYGLSPEDVGKSLMFMSHETYTPRRGGSAAAEIRSIRETFGTMASKIHIANTKGFTGHPMGAGIEDSIAILSMEKGQIPPIANFKEPDPDLGDLRLSKGEKVNVEYILRLAAGFGSQIAFALYKRLSNGDRFGSKYNDWLTSIGGSRGDLFKEGKTLRMKDHHVLGKSKGIKGSDKITVGERSAPFVKHRPPVSKPDIKTTKLNNVSGKGVSSIDRSEVERIIFNIMEKLTGYSRDLLDPNLDIESDLGIDTIKIAESISAMNESFGLAPEKGMIITDYPTLNHVTDYYLKRLNENDVQAIPSIELKDELKSFTVIDKEEILDKIQDTMVKMTGYSKEMLDPELDIEADLGVDSIKIAESINLMNKTFGLTSQEGMNIADYPTLNDVTEYYVKRIEREGRAIETQAKDEREEDNVLIKIIKIVSGLTGYPEVMITGPEIHLQNDLGVDSETKLQINSKIGTEFNINQAVLKDTTTIQEMINIINGEIPLLYKSIKGKASRTLAATSPALEDGKSIVLSIISLKTGYPEMMLDESINLEVDLGANEETKFSIFDEISKELNVNAQNFKNCQTISDILLVISGGTPKPIDVKKDQPKTVEKISPPQTSKILSNDARDEVIDEIVSIIAKKTGYPLELLDPTADLEADLGIDTVKQLEIFGIAREKYQIPPIEGMLISEYNTINKIAKLIVESSGDISEASVTSTDIDEITPEKFGSPKQTHRYVIRYNKSNSSGSFSGQGIIIGGKKLEYSSLMEKYELERVTSLKTVQKIEKGTTIIFINPRPREVTNVPNLFKFIKENIDNISKLVLAVSSGKANSPSIHNMSPLQGAMGGMFKALAMEFPNLTSRIIVFEKIDQLKQELGYEGIEVIYCKNERFEVALSEEDLGSSDWKLSKEKVILASGGAQGITFEILKEILQDGNTAILLGRTAIRDDAAEISKLSQKELDQRKWDLMGHLKETMDKVTPVILENEWTKIIKSANVFSAIKELEELGVGVIYKSVDIRNKSDMRKSLDKIKTTLNGKQITHIIHAAGIEISRATKSKKLEEFNLVYDVKVKGFENILSEIDLEALEKIIAFSSVAGRFGNATQTDYSAANEYIAKRCYELNLQGISTLVIDWSAWADVGMATRGSTMQVLESQGVTPIPLKIGISRFIEEVSLGNEVEIVISGELGQLASKINWFKPDAYKGVMLDHVQGNTSERILSLSKDLYLEDHRIDGKIVLPGVMGLETMAELIRAIKGESVKSFFDVEFNSPVKLPRDKDLEIVSRADGGGSLIKLTLMSKFLGPDGKQLGELRPHFGVKAILGQRIGGYPVMTEEFVKKVSKNNFLDHSLIYDVMFHGPSYQVIRQLCYVSENALIVNYNHPEKLMFKDPVDFEINPLALELAFQTAGLHYLIKNKILGLPASVDAIHIFDNQTIPKIARAIYLHSTDTHSWFNIEIIDKTGKCLILIDNYKMIHTVEMHVPDLSINKDKGLDIVKALAGAVEPKLITIDIEAMKTVDEEFLNELFVESEQLRLSKIKIQKKRFEWLSGRMAAKLALAKYTQSEFNKIEILKDENRSPYAIVNGEKIDVSISHSNGIAMAIAGDETVDVELVQPRDSSFIDESFSKEEIKKLKLKKLDDVSITRFWTLKEAHLKRMRIGLKTDLHGVNIVSFDSKGAEVKSPQGSSLISSSTRDVWVLSVARGN